MKIKFLTIQIIVIILISIVSIIALYLSSKQNNNIEYERNLFNDKNNLVHLKTSKLIWPEQFLIALASELGYMREENIVIDYVSDDYVIKESLESLMENKIDFATVMASDYYEEAKKGGNNSPKIVIAVNYSNGNDIILARKDAPPISSKVGKKRFSGNEDFDFFIKYALRQTGAATDTIEYVNTDSDKQRFEMLEKGELDYIVTDAYMSKEAIRNGAKVIYSSGDSYGILIDTLIFKKEITENKIIINGFTSAYFKAYNYWKKHPDIAYRKIKKYFILNSDEMSSYMRNIVMLSLDDNYGLMSSQVGVDSLYGNLKLAQAFDFNTEDYNPISIDNLIYSDAVKETNRGAYKNNNQ